MKPKQLYRSLTLWSGILVMGFICWAWWDSMTCASSMKTPNYEFTNFAGLAAMQYDSSPWGRVPFEVERIITIRNAEITPFGRAGFERGRDLKSDNPIEPLMAFNPRNDWILLLPHWVLLLAVALPWTGLLLWRARRHRRA